MDVDLISLFEIRTQYTKSVRNPGRGIHGCCEKTGFCQFQGASASLRDTSAGCYNIHDLLIIWEQKSYDEHKERDDPEEDDEDR